VPVWHETVKEWVSQGKLQIIGVIQEQHPERCELFRQWQAFDWPILHDPINVLNTTAVPIFVAIDQHGIVRSVRPDSGRFAEDFINRDFSDDASNNSKPLTPPRQVNDRPDTDARTQGDVLALWHSPEKIDAAISAYRQALQTSPDDDRSHFRLGVCLMRRFESQKRRVGDFGAAIASWETALAGNPNQYTWRRRIQQYGPRLDKPYPFYDWVDQAQHDIRARGDTPIELPQPPLGAEIAAPTDRFATAKDNAVNPDPAGKIFRDTERLVQISVTTVPSQPKPGSTVAVHIHFVPNPVTRTFWNNESEPLRLWINQSDDVTLNQHFIKGVNRPSAETDEVRRLEFEVRIPEEATLPIRINGYALYYVCEDVRGVCQFLRQDISFSLGK